MKDLQSTYTMRDMVKMFRRLDDLTRANSALTKQLTTAQADLGQAKHEIADLTTQLDDIQGDFVRQMTRPRVLAVNRLNEC